MKGAVIVETKELKFDRIAYCAGMDPEDYKAACFVSPGVSHIDYTNYEKTYEGNLETSNTDVFNILEELFTMLNINHPVDYKGHSLSVSDIIVINGHYYYCDAHGWKEVDFNVL